MYFLNAILGLDRKGAAIVETVIIERVFGVHVLTDLALFVGRDGHGRVGVGE